MTRTVLYLAILALAATFFAPPATAAAKSFDLTTGTAAAGAIFKMGATTNPTLNVDPGDTVTVNLTNTDPAANVQPHNFKVTGITGSTIPASGYLTALNASAEGTFTIPAGAGATYEYLCEIHPTSMKGDLKVSGTAETPKGTPGFEMVAVLAAVAGAILLLRRR